MQRELKGQGSSVVEDHAIRALQRSGEVDYSFVGAKPSSLLSAPPDRNTTDLEGQVPLADAGQDANSLHVSEGVDHTMDCEKPMGQVSAHSDLINATELEGHIGVVDEDQRKRALCSSEGVDRCPRGGKPIYGVSAPSELIGSIRAWHRERCFAMEQRKRIDLALGSFLRTALGWRRDKSESERGRIAKLAQTIVANAEAGLPQSQFANVVQASLLSREPWDAIESDADKKLTTLAKQLPVWSSFCADVRGFGPGSLAVIVGEAGDLSNYPDKSKLWKRMGVAVFDGVRQGGLSKNARKEDWIAHGYSPLRRSRMWNIGDALIKGNKDGKYRAAYLRRKQYERDRAVASGLTVLPAAKIPKKQADKYMSEGHIHRRAQRYMEKMLLRDLRAAWVSSS